MIGTVSRQIAENTAFADIQGAGDFGDFQASVAKFEGSFGDGFGGAGFSAGIETTSSGDSDSAGLTFAAVTERASEQSLRNSLIELDRSLYLQSHPCWLSRITDTLQRCDQILLRDLDTRPSN